MAEEAASSSDSSRVERKFLEGLINYTIKTKESERGGPPLQEAIASVTLYVGAMLKPDVELTSEKIEIIQEALREQIIELWKKETQLLIKEERESVIKQRLEKIKNA